MMTRENKIAFFENVTNDHLLRQYEFAINRTKSHDLKTQIEGNEDCELIKKELLKRLNK